MGIALEGEAIDVAIVGGGVVGCAMARRFALEGARVVLLEKASDILDGASKANSAILHTGFDADTGSLELACIRAGYEEYHRICAGLGLPFLATTAHVVAWSDEEDAALDGIVAKAHANGVTDVQRISRDQLRTAEPALADHVVAAVRVPGEGLIDPWSAPYAYLQQALDAGARIFTRCKVTGGDFDGNLWHLATTRGPLKARVVINCAGLYGDLLDQALLGAAAFHITPRKGQFVVYDKAASALARSIILPVPTKRTKGIVLTRTIFGNLLVGPTAQDQPSRSDAGTDRNTLRTLMAAGEEKLPGLRHMPVTATYAGLRPASEFKDFQIAAHPAQNWITVGGIRSTGLSAALGVARHVHGLYTAMGHHHRPPKAPPPPRAHRLSQYHDRDWQAPDHGEIICHCELVTAREISAALAGPLAAASLSGLKRQTRVTMGRCQGFFCSARLARLTAGHFVPPLTTPVTEGPAPQPEEQADE